MVSLTPDHHLGFCQNALRRINLRGQADPGDGLARARTPATLSRSPQDRCPATALPGIDTVRPVKRAWVGAAGKAWLPNQIRGNVEMVTHFFSTCGCDPAAAHEFRAESELLAKSIWRATFAVTRNPAMACVGEDSCPPSNVCAWVRESVVIELPVPGFFHRWQRWQGTPVKRNPLPSAAALARRGMRCQRLPARNALPSAASVANGCQSCQRLPARNALPSAASVANGCHRGMSRSPCRKLAGFVTSCRMLPDGADVGHQTTGTPLVRFSQGPGAKMD
jgi:hypothetical protein